MASLVSAVQNALASIAASLPDAVRRMSHGNEAGDAISVSSVEVGGESASESGAVEKSRVIVTASDFPTLDRDDLVTISGVPFIVTSMRKDPVGASATVGISEPLSKVDADYSGTRGPRRIRFPLDMLAENNGKTMDIGETVAPTDVYSWTLAVQEDTWPDATPPSVGDELRFEKDGPQRVRVSRVVTRSKHFILSVRSR